MHWKFNPGCFHKICMPSSTCRNSDLTGERLRHEYLLKTPGESNVQAADIPYVNTHPLLLPFVAYTWEDWD